MYYLEDLQKACLNYRLSPPKVQYNSVIFAQTFDIASIWRPHRLLI
jgi:hypothetical protein